MPAPSEPLTATSISRYLLSCGTALWLLMLVLQPEVGFRAPVAWMAVFWALQIGIGLAVLQGVLLALTRAFGAGRCPIWLLVLASGVLGAVVLAPFYWLIGEGLMQHGLGFAEIGDDDADGPPVPATAAMALAHEFLDIVGPVTAAWVLISLPRLNGLVPPLLDDRAAESAGDTAPADVAGAPRADAAATTAPPLPAPTAPVAEWRKRLPPELGQDVIAVASELQYLRVWTRRGCALVLGALQEVDDGEGTAGLRVHRSWWVHAGHVLRVRSTPAGAVCEMSDGRSVPVSRRRKAEVVARFGDGARYQVPGPTDDPAPPGPDPRPVDQKLRRTPT